MNKPLIHEYTCRVTAFTGLANRRGWQDGDEDYCDCDLRERIKDTRALDTRTRDLFGGDGGDE